MYMGEEQLIPKSERRRQKANGKHKRRNGHGRYKKRTVMKPYGKESVRVLYRHGDKVPIGLDSMQATRSRGIYKNPSMKGLRNLATYYITRPDITI